MKAASVHELKRELEHRNQTELLSFCLRLAKFKKENKELLTFLLFESDDMAIYIENVRKETGVLFNDINNSNIYYIKKSVRKILRFVNKHIRFASSKQAEAEIMIHFCNSMIEFSIPLHKSKPLLNMYETQIRKIDEVLSTLHPDLQYDLKKQLKARE
ncbi:MAG: hypothetical protein ABI472_12860 [Ginsengibacter sp.]